MDQSIPVPLYYQLKNLIRQRIEQGELLPGDKIPTEAELCEQFNISRTPVRQALLELTKEGYLTRKAGRGTFVALRDQTSIDLEVIVPDARWQWLLEAAASTWNAQHAPQTINLNFVSIPLAELHDAFAFAVARGQALRTT